MTETTDAHATARRLAAATPAPQIGGIPDFWHRIDTAAAISLFLDFDGTLAPFHPDRMMAYPLAGTVEAVRDIDMQPNTTVAIISGRPISEILTLLGNLGVVVSGAHGYELFAPDGGQQVVAIAAEQRILLDAAYRQALEIFPPERVERKAASVAAHIRGLDPVAAADAVERLERRWRAAGSGDLIDYRPFNGGLELRAVGRTKGTVIEEMIAAAPDALPIYIGDDDTDEDAFRVLDGRGIGIKVGPPDAVTLASGRVTNCEAVRDLLVYWATREATR